MSDQVCDYPDCDRTDTSPVWSDPDDGLMPLCPEHAGPQVDEPEPLPAMTDAELRIAREDLGVTAEWLADRIGVTLRTVRRWEAGTSRVPDGAANDVGALTDQADAQVDAWVTRLLDVPEPVLRIPRDGQVDGWPAGWWRAIAARVVEQVPGCRVVYTEG